MTRRRVSAFAVIALGLFLKGADIESRHPLPGLGRGQVRAVIDTVSGERALADIRSLALIHRWFVSPGYDSAAEYVMGRARAAGLSDVRMEKFPSDGAIFYSMMRSLPRWTVDRAELRMTSPRLQHLVSWAEMPTCLASNSRSASVEAELVDVGEGVNASDYEGKDVRGKLVLASSPQGRGRIELVHRLAVLERGAAGVVSYRSYYPDDFPDLVTWDHIFTLEENGQPSTFGFCVSKRLGRELQSLLRDGQKVTLQADIKAELAPGALGVVEATIPGTDFPEQEVWYIAHLDHACPGANDNASGSAAILECARAFLDLLKAGSLPGPRRTLRFLWVPEMYGTTAYLVSHPERVRRAVAVINMDMVGENQRLCGSTFQVTRTPDSTPSYLNDLLATGLDLLLGNPLLAGQETSGFEAVTSPTGTRDPWQARLVPYSGGSDHEVLMGGGFSVPATMFGSWPDYFYHSNEDTPDKCDTTQLRRAVVLAMIAGASIASMGPEDALDFTETLTARALQRINQDVERGFRGLEGSSLRSPDLRQAMDAVTCGLEREKGVLSSLEKLFPGDTSVARLAGRRVAALERQAQSGQALVLDMYAELCRRRGVEPVRFPAQPSPWEKAASAIIPIRKPAFPGPISEEYIALRLGSQEEPYIAPFGEVAAFEIGAFIDGRRSALDITNAVSAECGRVDLADVITFLERLEKADVITLKTRPRAR